MLNENKNESYICHSNLQTTSNNTIVIENMTDIKEKEFCYDSDTTVKCGNKMKKNYELNWKM